MSGNQNQMRDKHLWLFNGGADFSGNPKWLFMYIVKHHKEIQPVWLCYNEANMKYVRRLGFRAFMFQSKKAKQIMKRAGVYVVNQMKEVLQPELDGITILNLWHGVGCKAIEKNVIGGFLEKGVVKKNIRNASNYLNNQLFLVTSPLMEKHFLLHCNIRKEHLIRAGYPCCVRREEVSTFDHDILAQKGLPKDTRIAVYAPTYRDASPNTFFEKAIPDMERLVRKLQEQQMLLIFKMHPLMNNDFRYQQLKKQWCNHPNLLFWDNQNDIYEIFNRIELAIIDYSSIFYDMLAGGVRYFIRYMFDLDEPDNMRDFVFDVKEMTCGKMVDSFDQLLDALDHYQQDDESERKRIYDLFWSYSSDDSMEQIISQAISFVPSEEELPTLYSFDIFDTLICRKGGLPVSIFYKIQEKMIHSGLDFPDYLVRNFVQTRRFCEANEREYYKKLQDAHPVDRLEITLSQIYDRMAEQYHLTDAQKNYLVQTEIQEEINDCIPDPERVELVKELLAANEKVVLISDMYLPKEVIQAMLKKADPVLAELPLYLSSDCGVQKTTLKLYYHVFHDLDYRFGKWVHYGDNAFADRKQPCSIGIETVNHQAISFNRYEKALVNRLQSYDAYCTAAMMNRFCKEELPNSAIRYAYQYASLYFVPYVGWAIKDAMARGIQCLYFISRDGYHLKRIADAIIETKGYNIRTKYIYGSRKAWRVPSEIGELDEEFFSVFGQFGGCKDFKALLKALNMDEKTFDEYFPELSEIKSISTFSKKIQANLRHAFKNSPRYIKRVLEQSEKERPIVLDYLRQEIDLDEKFAFVEYWGRGYTQDCLGRLLCEVSGQKMDVPFYYVRSIYPTIGHSIRYNFTVNRASLLFVEVLFANMPYRSIEKYQIENGRVVPVLNSCDNDPGLFDAFSTYLPQFARDFYSMDLLDEDTIEKELFDFAMGYYKDCTTDPCIVDNLGHLNYSETMYNKVTEYAPAITFRTLVMRLRGTWFQTRNLPISLARSKKFYSKLYVLYHNKLRHKKWIKKIIQWKRKHFKRR